MWVRTPSRPLEYLCNKGSKQGGCTSSPLERAQWELTQQDGEKNEDGRVTKKGRTRSGIQDIFRHSVALLPSCCVRSLLSPAKVPQPFWGKCFQHHNFQGQHHSVNMFCLFFLFFQLTGETILKKKISKKKESQGKMNKLFHQPRDVAMTVCIYRVAILSGLCDFTHAHCHITLAIYKPWIIVWDLLGRINMA